MGSLVPSQGKRSCLAQLYVHDTANELDNQMNFFGSVGKSRASADPDR
jgi:hypothetical protein